MVQDYTKVGIQPEQPGPGQGIGKLPGAAPLGIDDPTRGLRKGISAAWGLLAVLKYGLGSAVFLLFGGASLYAGLAAGLVPKLLAFGIGSLALSALFARWTVHAVRDLRAIARA